MRRLMVLVVTVALGLAVTSAAAPAASAGAFTVNMWRPPMLLSNAGACVWEAGVTGGVEPFTYVWYRSGELVGTEYFYQEFSPTRSFNLVVEVTDANGDLGSAYKFISVQSSSGVNCE